MTNETNQYSAFISYRHMARDRQWAIRIMSELEAYRTPKALQWEAFPNRIGRLFRDEDEIPASSDLSDQIKDALARSDFLIVVCSPDTPASRWVRREIELFQELGKSERIIPLLIAGEPDKSFPPELRWRYVAVPRADGSTDFEWEEVEPVAADVRPRKDEGRAKTERRALMRLAAALLGCRFDDLARRDEERRKRRFLVQAGAASMAAMFLATAGALWWRQASTAGLSLAHTTAEKLAEQSAVALTNSNDDLALRLAVIAAKMDAKQGAPAHLKSHDNSVETSMASGVARRDRGFWRGLLQCEGRSNCGLYEFMLCGCGKSRQGKNLWSLTDSRIRSTAPPSPPTGRASPSLRAESRQPSGTWQPGSKRSR